MPQLRQCILVICNEEDVVGWARLTTGGIVCEA